ncbi:Glutaredoxin domain-containing protein, partial [Trichostrongylus colubriformis]
MWHINTFLTSIKNISHLKKTICVLGARTAIPWNGRDLPSTFTYNYASGPSPSAHLTFHSYAPSPSVSSSSYQQPYNFDFSQLFTNQASAASAYATNAAQFAQQYTATAPPVNAQVDQQNLVKYSQYLDLLRNAYGIQLPGELGQQSSQSHAEYQLSAYPSATATTYQAGAGQQTAQAQAGYQTPNYLPPAAPTYETAQQPVQSQIQYQMTGYPTASGQYPAGAAPYHPAVQTVEQTVQRPAVTYAASTAAPQSQYQIYQPQSFYGQAGQPQQQTVYQPSTQQTYPQPVQTQAQSYQQLLPHPQPPQRPAQVQYPSPYSATQVPLNSQEYTAPSQQPQNPPQQTIQYPGQQVSSGVPQLPSQGQPQQQTTTYGQQGVPTYQTAALTYPPSYPQPSVQSQQPKPTVYTYRPGQAVHPTYSSNLASQSSEQREYETNSVSEPETVGSVYGGEYPTAVEEIYTPPQTPATSRSTTTPRPRTTTTRPRPQTTPPPQATSTKPQTTTAITSQSLTQQ